MIFNDVFNHVAADHSTNRSFKQLVYEFLRDIIHVKRMYQRCTRDWSQNYSHVEIYLNNMSYYHDQLQKYNSWGISKVNECSDYLIKLLARVDPTTFKVFLPQTVTSTSVPITVSEEVHQEDAPTTAGTCTTSDINASILASVALFLQNNISPTFEFTYQKGNKKIAINVSEC